MPDVVFLIIGIISAALGLVIFAGFIVSKASCSLKLTATVTEVKTSTLYVRGSKTYRYHPVYSYEVDGKEYSCEAPFDSGSAKKFREGDTRMIGVNPKRPESITFKGRFTALLWAVLFMIIGLFFVVLFFI